MMMRSLLWVTVMSDGVRGVRALRAVVDDRGGTIDAGGAADAGVMDGGPADAGGWQRDALFRRADR